MSRILKGKKIPAYHIMVIIVLAILLSQFVVNTKYTFPEPHQFKGDLLYNPYKDIGWKKWELANFHAHTHLYLGLTSGYANHDDSLVRYYKYFNYNIIGISNYQNIDRFESKSKWYIPEYEHGYQYFKTHQLVLNAKKVSWLDYFFRQTLDNKQYIIDNLKKDSSALLAIVHPDRRKAYCLSDFRYLGNYDCFEIADNEALYTSYYDTILSSGHPVFLIGDDDTHDISKKNDACQTFNMINSGLVRDSVLHAIRTGCLIAVRLPHQDLTNEKKKSEILELPKITGVTIRNDTVSVSLNQIVRTIRFIGQNGVEKKKITDSESGSYFFSNDDTYIRTEIECRDGSIYYLNPVFRYDGVGLIDDPPEENIVKTWVWRTAVVVLTLVLIIAANRRRTILKLH
ncbi:MAG: hypothetical protein Q8868_15415 [Bacteroidota bacterium]|nr:hypothetical protein [Bacteroidota bacterium]